MQVEIRKYNEADRQRVLEIFWLNVPAYFAATEEPDLLYYLEEESSSFFVCTVDSIIAGCGGYNVAEDGRSARISWDFLHPASQGKGYGKKLLDYRISQLQKIQGLQRIVVRTSQHTFGFYERAGFKLSYITRDFWAPGFDLYYMERLLFI